MMPTLTERSAAISSSAPTSGADDWDIEGAVDAVDDEDDNDAEVAEVAEAAEI